MSKQIVFFGTPKIAASCLQALLDANIDVLAVVTKPDMPVGHKQKIKESAVKILAKQHNILVLQPHKLNDIYNQLNELKADLFIVCAYGKLINEKILRLPKFHCINVHTSLLPRWRGGAPIHYAILAGDKLSGISLMYMSKELDAGNVIYQQTIPIDQYETYHSLYDKLAKLAYHTLKNKIHSLFDLHIPSQSQDVSFVTFAKNINRTDELIKWNNSNQQIERQVRGLFDKPIASTFYENFNIKIHEAIAINIDINNEPGTIIKIDKEGMDVACGNHKILRIIKLQLPSKKPLYIKAMINGNHPFKINQKFTD